jgi:hypothetical protein
VEERQEAQLDAAGAKRVFRDIEQKLDQATGRRLTLSWRIEEPGEK